MALRFAEVLPRMLKLPMGVDLPESRTRHFWSEERLEAKICTAYGNWTHQAVSKEIYWDHKKCHDFAKSCFVVFLLEL